MNKRGRNYYAFHPKVLGSAITRRKARLLRIACNAHKRHAGLMSKRLAGAIRTIYGEGAFIGRDGWPISARAYARHQEDGDYVIVAVDWYRGRKVSTIWLGKLWPDGFRDYLYETMVFDDSRASNQERYMTEAEALRGHAEMLDFVRRTVDEPPDLITCTAKDLESGEA